MIKNKKLLMSLSVIMLPAGFFYYKKTFKERHCCLIVENGRIMGISGLNVVMMDIKDYLLSKSESFKWNLLKMDHDFWIIQNRKNKLFVSFNLFDKSITLSGNIMNALMFKQNHELALICFIDNQDYKMIETSDHKLSLIHSDTNTNAFNRLKPVFIV